MGSTEERNMELMQALDDAWNADWDTFDERHRHGVVVRWPGQPPTNGIHDHRAEAIEMFKTFPDNRVENRPYEVFFASGDRTCSIARFTGTMTEWRDPDSNWGHHDLQASMQAPFESAWVGRFKRTSPRDPWME